MTEFKNIDGRYYPRVHSGWGGFAEELFYYTSRYYCTTEAFLRNLADDSRFRMSGYKASRLSALQRELMAAILAGGPDSAAAGAVITIVDTVLAGGEAVDSSLAERYRAEVVPHDTAEAHPAAHAGVAPQVDPLDPFLAMAERLLMPVAVRGRHVEVSMRLLAHHLDSTNSRVRSNLQEAVIALHNAGFVLRNHPHLTHNEAQEIGDDGSV